jgi:hypothetical protein
MIPAVVFWRYRRRRARTGQSDDPTDGSAASGEASGNSSARASARTPGRGASAGTSLVVLAVMVATLALPAAALWRYRRPRAGFNKP